MHEGGVEIHYIQDMENKRICSVTKYLALDQVDIVIERSEG